jgi:hypothetical protein
MAQVPYSGVPQVAPGGEATPRYSADTPIGAFGGASAAAMGTLGKQIEGAGNEVFQRGLAMQDLYNHSEAQEADAKYMETAGKLHADYSSLSGKAAVDAYPKYIQDLKDSRDGLKATLSNGMSQKLFDSQSLSTMGRTIFNGAGHAATENKKYALGASKARVEAISDQTLAQPQDDKAFQAGLETSEREVRAQAQLAGIGSDPVAALVPTDHRDGEVGPVAGWEDVERRGEVRRASRAGYRQGHQCGSASAEHSWSPDDFPRCLHRGRSTLGRRAD